MSNNADVALRRQAAVPRGIATACGGIFADRAENAELWDVEGRRYLDFAGGIAVLNTGHRHPKVIAAVQAQLTRFTHTAFQVMAYDSYVTLAERINALAPVAGPAKTVLMTTGAEAVENAVKIARAYTGRPGVIAFSGGFHGRSLLTMALTGKVVPYKVGFGPFPAGIYHVPFPIPHHGIDADRALAAIEQVFKVEIEPRQVAAIIIEPVQGEGGFYIAPPGFLARLREICDRHGILLIADEVQTGFARTGRMFAIEHSGVKPDLITMAKSMAGGFPLSGVVGRADVMDSCAPGGLGGTYGGNPVACAAALAVLEVIEEDNLLARSQHIGSFVESRLRPFARRSDMPPIGDIRGLGGMVAFELVRERGSHEPNPDTAKRLTSAALDKGLVLLSCGAYGNTIRLLMPLTISNEVLEEGMELLEAALTDL